MLGIRGWAVLVFSCVILTGLTVSFAKTEAEKPHQGDGDHAKATDNGGGHEGGHAQESYTDVIFKPALDLALWTLVVFLLLLFVLTRYAWKPMLAGLQKREEGIRSAMEEATKAREETEKMRKEFDAERHQQAQKISQMMEEARQDAENLRQELKTKANEEIQTERARLRREIETAKDQALQEIWNQAAQLATAISTKAIRRTLSQEDQNRLMDEALAHVNEAREKRQEEMRQFGEEWVRQGGSNEGTSS